ncbi:MAG: phosphodiester glycosidase family protein [Deltaproteobacteria bacterium]|nr:phosphodiester glycosidase family protein [Deltaproteobacteria bacterium]
MQRPLPLLVLALLACDSTPESTRARIERGHVATVAASDAAPEDATATLDVGAAPDADGVSSGLDIPDTGPADVTAEPDDAPSEDVAPTEVITDADAAPEPDVEVIAPEPLGTFDDPHVVARWPWVVAHSTSDAVSDHLDRYGCAPAIGEAGPERVYRFELDVPGRVVVELDEADGVDVDLHLLAAAPSSDATEADCLARANTRLEQDLAAGVYWLVVDSYSSAAGEHGGDYRVAFERIVLDRWQVVEVAPGVTWRQKVYASYAGGRQTINVLAVDLSHPEVAVRPHLGAGCSRPSAVGPAVGAIAVINGGFFDTGPGTCPPLDLVKIDGEVESTNRLTGAAQRSFGVTAAGEPLMAWVDAGADWPEAHHALGAYPSLVTDGAVRVEPDRDTSFFDSRHPRSALGLTADGVLLLVTVDGRTDAGVGMTMAALAQHMVNLGAVDAVNLDGGGSTAMWIRGQSLDGIVNFPSDDGDTDHEGERGVADLLTVVPR